MTDTKPTPMKPGEPFTPSSLRYFAQNIAEIRDEVQGSGPDLRSASIDESRELARKGFPVAAADFAAVDETLTDAIAVLVGVLPHLEATLAVLETQSRHLELAKGTLLEVEWRGSRNTWDDDGRLREHWACPICDRRKDEGVHEVGCQMGDTLMELCPPERSEGPRS